MGIKTVKYCDICKGIKEPVTTFRMNRHGHILEDLYDEDPEDTKSFDICWSCVCRFIGKGLIKDGIV